MSVDKVGNVDHEGEAVTTRVMGFPVLTEEQRQALFERKDHGITPAPLVHFDTYEAWKNRGPEATQNIGYFLGIGQERSRFDGFRELQCFQRYALLYPESVTDLAQRVKAIPTGGRPDEETDMLLWDAYEKMAALADIHDAGLNGDNLPEGEIDPRVLMM